MANELRVRVKVDYNPASGDPVNIPWIDEFIAQTGADYTSGTQLIGSSAEEVIAVGADIATHGLWLIINLDGTNFVNVGKVKVTTDLDAMPMKALAGEPLLFRATGAPYAKADTADVLIRFYCFEL